MTRRAVRVLPVYVLAFLVGFGFALLYLKAAFTAGGLIGGAIAVAVFAAFAFTVHRRGGKRVRRVS